MLCDCRRGDDSWAGHQQQPQPQQQQSAQQQHPSCAAASRADIIARCRPQLAWSVAVIFLLLPFLERFVDPPAVVWKLLLVASELGFPLQTDSSSAAVGAPFGMCPFRLWSHQQLVPPSACAPLDPAACVHVACIFHVACTSLGLCLLYAYNTTQAWWCSATMCSPFGAGRTSTRSSCASWCALLSW